MLRGIGREFIEEERHRDQRVFGKQQIGSRPADARKGRLDLAQQRVHRPGHEIGAEQDILRAVERIEPRSEEHTSELQSLMRRSYAVFCLKKKNTKKRIT